jgi:serine/threonine-protein kinase
MSPEQVLGRDLDGRSDLYSAAIVLYEALTGRTPFDDGEKSELMVRASQVDDTPPPLTYLLPQAPPVMDLLFARALAKNPDHRYPSAIELGNAFCQALGIPETPGWKAQREFARRATGMVPAAMVPPRKKGGTQPIPQVDADAMRNRLADAYVK